MTQESAEKQSRGSSFLRGTLILTVGGVVVKAIGFLNWMPLSRILSGEGIGLYQMAFPLYLMALSISSAGVPTAISIITAEKLAHADYRGANRVFGLSLGALTLTGLLCSLLLYFGADFLITYQFIHDARAYYALLALAPAVFFVTILSSFRGYLQGCQIMTPTAVSQIVEQLVRVVTMLIFASMLLPYGLEYAAAGASFGAAPGALAGLLVLIYYYRKVNKEFKQQIALQDERIAQESAGSIFRRIAKLALPVSLASLMLPVVANLDLFIVPVRLEAAGYTVEQATELFGYLTGMAVPLLNLATILTAALATSLVPSISEAFALKNKQQIYERTASATHIANLVTVPACVILWLLARPIAAIVYNAPEAGQSISIIAIGVFVLGLHQVSTGVLQGMGHTVIPVVNMGLAVVVKVILNWVLTAMPSLGIQGATWATVADIGVAAVINMYFIKRYTGFWLNMGSLLKVLAAAAAMSVAVYFSYGFMIFETNSMVVSAMVSILLGCAVYGGALVAVGGVTERHVRKIPMVGSRLASLLCRFKLLKASSDL